MICDRLTSDISLYEDDSKKTENDDSHASLAVGYPFINNIKSIMFNIGYYGKIIGKEEYILLEDLKVLSNIVGADGAQMKSRISNPKLIKSLRFLNSCGIEFEGIDLEEKTLDISKVESIKISYINNPAMLLGLKVMAIAQRHLYVKGNHDIFLRCDYNVIKDENTEIILILKDFVYSLPKDVQDFAINLHEYCMKIGFTCKLDIFYLGIRFIYFYKNKEVQLTKSAKTKQINLNGVVERHHFLRR